MRKHLRAALYATAALSAFMFAFFAAAPNFFLHG